MKEKILEIIDKRIEELIYFKDSLKDDNENKDVTNAILLEIEDLKEEIEKIER